MFEAVYTIPINDAFAAETDNSASARSCLVQRLSLTTQRISLMELIISLLQPIVYHVLSDGTAKPELLSYAGRVKASFISSYVVMQVYTAHVVQQDDSYVIG